MKKAVTAEFKRRDLLCSDLLVSNRKMYFIFKESLCFCSRIFSVKVFLSVLALLLLASSRISAETAAGTQGEYAVALADRLDLGKNLTQEQAAATLSGIGIEPHGGWQLGVQVDETFLNGLRNAAWQAVRKGTLSSDQLNKLLGSGDQLSSQSLESNISILQAPIGASKMAKGPSAVELLFSGQIPDANSA